MQPVKQKVKVKVKVKRKVKKKVKRKVTKTGSTVPAPSVVQTSTSSAQPLPSISSSDDTALTANAPQKQVSQREQYCSQAPLQTIKESSDSVSQDSLTFVAKEHSNNSNSVVKEECDDKEIAQPKTVLRYGKKLSKSKNSSKIKPLKSQQPRLKKRPPNYGTIRSGVKKSVTPFKAKRKLLSRKVINRTKKRRAKKCRRRDKKEEEGEDGKDEEGGEEEEKEEEEVEVEEEEEREGRRKA